MKGLKALPWYQYGFAIIIFLCLMEIWGILGNWCTIVLAVFTMIYVMFIYKSILQSSNLRKEDRVLDFKRRKLDWIVNWAREVRKEIIIPRLLGGYFSENSADLRAALESYVVENEEIIMTAKIFGEEFQRIVEQAAKDLWAYIEELKKAYPHDY